MQDYFIRDSKDTVDFIYRVCISISYPKLYFDFLNPTDAFLFSKSAMQFWNEGLLNGELSITVSLLEKEESK